MAKKKKKSKAPQPSSSSETSKPAPVRAHHDVLPLLSVCVVDSQTPPVKMLKYTPMIVLSPGDADRLDLIAGDKVFLLSTNREDEVLQTSAIARVHIANNVTIPPLGSPLRSPLSSPRAQRSKVSPGRCLVFPVSLAQQIRGIANPTQAPSPQTPRGGKSSTLREVWVIPVESTLGYRLSTILCRDAATVTLVACKEEKISSQASSLLAETSLGQQLLRAHVEGCFLSEGCKVVISIQGITVGCQVDCIREAMTKTVSGSSNLVSKMARLSIQNAETEDDISLLIDSAEEAAESDHRAEKLLFQITSETCIVFGNRIQSNEVESKSSASCAALGSNTQLVAAVDNTVERIQALLTTPLLHPELFNASSGLRPPRGALLHGPSGVGKSSLALQVAQNMECFYNVHIQHVHCTTIQSQTAVVGKAEQELVRLFELAKKPRLGKSASLVLLDDVHLICPRRQGLNHGADRLSATLLALLDGMDHNATPYREGTGKNTTYYPMVILATTTNPSLLDPALRRPGRLDTEVEIPLPDEPEARSKILQLLFKSLGAKINEATDSDWISLARLAKGFTGADLRLAVKEAIRNVSVGKPADEVSTPVKVSNSGVQIIDVPKEALEAAIRATKPSAIKAVTVEIPQVHWSSIGGMEEVKNQLREAIELPLTHGSIFQKLGIRPPKGVLLYGPPGCSKTLMARALATEGHMNFLAVKGPELLSKWLGESERALASLFRRARLASPSVIFFDEVDAIATKRGGGNSGGERLLSQLLTELDGIQSPHSGTSTDKHIRVIVVCATNRPDLLDSALVRPGRIDRMIYVGVPDEKSRFRILEIGLAGKACAGDMDIFALAQDTISGGLSGAELVAACRDAALLALEEQESMDAACSSVAGHHPMVTMQHMIKSLSTMERQITTEMIDFYMDYQGKTRSSFQQ